MYKNKAILAVITARGGSKGIPRKNIRELAGKPLISYTIAAARASKYLDYFLVSTDDAEIADVSKGLGAPVPFMRPAELATDQAKSIPVVQHAIKWLEDNENRRFDYVMILQPTSPFRTAEDIDAAIEKIVDTGADSVMSMKKMTDLSLPKLKILDGDLILPLAESEGKESASRNDSREIYKRNCAIYLTRAELLAQGDLFGSVSRAYIMPEEKSIDINTPQDFEFAEFLLSEKNGSCILCGGRETEILCGRGILEKCGSPVEFNNVICRNCGLVFIWPQPDAKEYEKLYKQYENSRHGLKNESDIAGLVGDTGGKKAAEIYELVKNYLGPEKRILDIGAGFGHISAGLKNKYGCAVTAVEPSELLSQEMIKSGLNVFCGDFDAFFKENKEKFNAIILHHVFEHFTDPAETLRQLWKILTPGGVIFVALPDVSSFKKPVRHFFDYLHPFSYSPKTFRALVEKNNYKIIAANKENPYRLQIVIAPKESVHMDIGSDAMFERGGYRQTAGFIKKRKIIDWLAGAV